MRRRSAVTPAGITCRVLTIITYWVMLPAAMDYRTCHSHESAAFRLGLMLGTSGMAMAVMVLFAVFVHA